jgi:anthranilate synthase component 1
MFNALSFADFQNLAKTHRRITVFKEILGDLITPVQTYHALQAHMKGATLLESSPKEKMLGRYSFLGFNPQAQIKVKNKHIEIQDDQGVRVIDSAVLTALRDFYQARKAISSCALPGFAGGIVGFYAYDAARLFEETLQNDSNINDFPDIVFKSYQDHVMFDQKTEHVILATVVDIDNRPLEEIYNSAVSRLDDFYQQMLQTTAFVPRAVKSSSTPAIKACVDDNTYIEAGQKAKEHILKGDAFQIVLARTFKMNYSAKPFDIYRILRYRNPSPYMFYLDIDGMTICGASPEKMISIHNNVLQSCPLAGTRPRGDDINDVAQAADLLSDIKEVSEHMMLVDLARNDIGMVAKPGTVKVSSLKQIVHFSHVMHISSTVEAPLADDKDAFDALRASFPAGTLSGAPKIRAMQIIDDLEGERRQLYGGAIGFLDAQGDFDSCIAIRMAILKDNVAYVTAGAGIVADSDLQKEADETRHKARAVLEAIAFAESTSL